jgi:hypothetical protein
MKIDEFYNKHAVTAETGICVIGVRSKYGIWQRFWVQKQLCGGV